MIAPEAGRLHDLLREHGLDDVRLLDTHELIVTGATTAEVGEIAGAAGVFLHELSTNGSSLEDIFLELTATGGVTMILQLRSELVKLRSTRTNLDS